MHRIDHPSATNDNKFTAGDPGNAVPATTVTADFMNAVQEEIAAVIEAASIVLNKNSNVQLLAAIQALVPAGVPSGTVFDFAGTAVPTGYLACDGAAVSRSTYAALFTAIGTTHGAGNGTTTFNLPDYRGRTGIGEGQGSGLTNRTIGQHIGEETHTLTIAEMPSHDHVIPADASPGTGQGYMMDLTSTITSNTTFARGGDGAHNNMQPSIVVKKIIKI